MELYVMAEGISRAAASGDPAREEALRWFDELREPLRRYLLCSGAPAADVDEAVQESFLRLYQHLRRGATLSNGRAWVFQVARNYLRDERKSARRQRSVSLEDAAGREFEDPGAGPEHRAVEEQQTRRLREAVARLPKQQRECILLRSGGLRYREIAEVMGINPNSVGALVQRAMARLSEELV